MPPKQKQTTPLDERGSIAIPSLPHPHGLPSHTPHLSPGFKGWLSRLSKTKVLYGIGMTLAASSLGFAVLASQPKSADFNYSATQVCFAQPGLFPRASHLNSDSYAVEYKGGVFLGGTRLTSTQTCVTPLSAPIENESASLVIHQLGLGVIGSEITLNNQAYPNIINSPDTSKPIATTQALQFELDKPDYYFDYSLLVSDDALACDVSEATVSCPLETLELRQSQTYTFELERTQNDQKLGASYSQELTTVEALSVQSTTVNNEQLLYSKPKEIVLTFNKPVTDFGAISLTQTGETDAEIEHKIATADNTLSIVFDTDLPREKNFTLTIADIAADDGAELLKPYEISFATSGGPKVASTSLASYGTAYAPSFTVTFDQPISPSNVSELFSVSANNAAQNISVDASGSTATITAPDMGRCQAFSIALAAGLVSAEGVEGGQAWTAESRTLCQTVSSIGTSVEGRGIYAYSFGSGATTYLYTGGIHGSEASSVYTLNSWIDHLEANAPSIPANARIVVVPKVNPDGFATGARHNANGIDLNRNFPAANWKKDVIAPGGTLVENGGGTEPLSEKESSIIANYTLQLNPVLVMSYHAKGSLAIANESGDSLAKSIQYADMTGYAALNNSSVVGVFNYDTTGAYEDWLHDVPNIGTILVELTTATSNEFSRHKDAMWEMIK